MKTIDISTINYCRIANTYIYIYIYRWIWKYLLKIGAKLESQMHQLCSRPGTPPIYEPQMTCWCSHIWTCKVVPTSYKLGIRTWTIERPTSSTRTRRGGTCLRFDYKTFFIYRTCTRRARHVLASRQLVALLLAKNVTGVRPRCNATSSEHFLHTSHCTLHTLHFTLHTCTSHSTAPSSQIIWFLFTSCHLIWPLLIWSHPFSHVI